MNSYLLLFLLFPLIWPIVAWKLFSKTITFKEMLLNIILAVILTCSVWYCGKYSCMSDIEILNGEILDKKKTKGFYVTSYPCNCRTIGKTTSCSTCFQDHYTVSWDIHTSVGEVNVKYLDLPSAAAYAIPDPKVYKECEKEQPASLEHPYENYIKLAPESLFHLNPGNYNFKIPEYPRTFDFYKINRVLSDTIDPTNLNTILNKELKTLGKEKQVNIIVLLTKYNSNFKYAVERAWLAGKKNDVIVYIGLKENNIVWTGVTVWVNNIGNEYLAASLKEKLLIGNYDNNKIANIIVKEIRDNYHRTEMKSFEYLKEDFDPPTWLIIVSVFISVVGSLGLTFLFHKKEIV